SQGGCPRPWPRRASVQVSLRGWTRARRYVGGGGGTLAGHRVAARSARTPASLAAVTDTTHERDVPVWRLAPPRRALALPLPAPPAKAGEAIVAAGAPSDAEVRAELHQMEAVERSARAAARQRLTPVAGGHSIGGDGTIPVPASVPEVVQRVVAGANAIADFP